MARMHSGAKGQSGSTKPVEEKADWVEYKANEIIKIIIDLANTGLKKSQIGVILRDQYGIPNVKTLTGKKISAILDENNFKEELPEDLLNLIRKSVELQEHLTDHKKDFKAKRGYELTVSKIRRLAKYYAKKKKIPESWKYSEETAKLLVK